MKHLGDITQLKGNKIPKVDIITGGSPCQDLSVAGKREGLAGERSGLFMEQIRLIKEMRESDRADGRTDDYIRPRYMVWENVPGAFSSNKGEDFRCVLEETAKVADENATIPRLATGKDGKQKWSKSGCIMGDGWSIAWRVHDAQFWGVPQRRKRIALVADFGGETAPEILFEREGLPGNIAQGGNEGQGTATDAERSIRETISFQERGGKPGGGKGILIQKDRIGALSTLNNQSVLCIQGNCIDRSDTAGCNGKGWRENESYTLNTIDRHAVAYRKKGHPQNAEQGQGWEQTETNDTLNAFDNGESRTPTIVLDNHPQDSRFKIKEDGVFPTMSARQGAEGEPNTLMVLENHPNDSRVKIREDGTVQTLSSRMGTGGGNVPMVMSLNTEQQGPQAVCIGNGQTNQSVGEKAGAINCMHEQQAVITYGLDRASFNQGKNAKYDFSIEEEKIGAQVARGPGAVCKSVVRRLTPMECERLQGYPDGWTDIGDWIDSKGKKHKGEADSPRYKALGNSIALPFWQYLADKMCAYLNKPTMASLFDGIGGFPLVFSRAGAKPIWASEIEEFPIAVTKLRFKEEETHDM